MLGTVFASSFEVCCPVLVHFDQWTGFEDSGDQN